MWLASLRRKNRPEIYAPRNAKRDTSSDKPEILLRDTGEWEVSN